MWFCCYQRVSTFCFYYFSLGRDTFLFLLPSTCISPHLPHAPASLPPVQRAPGPLAGPHSPPWATSDPHGPFLPWLTSSCTICSFTIKSLRQERKRKEDNRKRLGAFYRLSSDKLRKPSHKSFTNSHLPHLYREGALDLRGAPGRQG